MSGGRWEVAAEYRADDAAVEMRLHEGWEPFAVDKAFYHFRRWVPTPPAKGKIVDETRCQCGLLVLGPDMLEHLSSEGRHVRAPWKCSR